MVRWGHVLWKRVAWELWCDIYPPIPSISTPFTELNIVTAFKAEVCKVEFDRVIRWNSDDVVTAETGGVRFREIGRHQNSAPPPSVPHQSWREEIFFIKNEIFLTPNKSPAIVVIISICLELNGDHVCPAHNFLFEIQYPREESSERVTRFMCPGFVPSLSVIVTLSIAWTRNFVKRIQMVNPSRTWIFWRWLRLFGYFPSLPLGEDKTPPVGSSLSDGINEPGNCIQDHTKQTVNLLHSKRQPVALLLSSVWKRTWTVSVKLVISCILIPTNPSHDW